MQDSLRKTHIRTGSGSDRPETHLQIIKLKATAETDRQLSLWPVATAPGSDERLQNDRISVYSQIALSI